MSQNGCEKTKTLFQNGWAKFLQTSFMKVLLAIHHGTIDLSKYYRYDYTVFHAADQ